MKEDSFFGFRIGNLNASSSPLLTSRRRNKDGGLRPSWRRGKASSLRKEGVTLFPVKRSLSLRWREGFFQSIPNVLIRPDIYCPRVIPITMGRHYLAAGLSML